MRRAIVHRRVARVPHAEDEFSHATPAPAARSASRPTWEGTIRLTSGQLAVGKALTIAGPGAPYGAFGGGVSVLDGNLVLERVTLSGNEATGNGYGGALAVHSNAGATTLRNVTVAGNSTTRNGGGLLLVNSNTGSPIVLEQVTIAGNDAGDDGGGLATNVTPRMVGSIVADNTASGSGPDCLASGSGSIVGEGANLIESVGDCTTTGTGTVISGEDPLLGPLALDGPGETETMALGADSPALDRAPTSGAGACPPPATDQRGVTRPQGAACDLGAFEARPAVATFAPGEHDFGARRVGAGPSAATALTLSNADDVDLPLAIAPPAPPVVEPPARTRPPAVASFRLAQRCVRPARNGRSKVGLNVRLTAATRVRVQFARALGTGGLARCPRRGGNGTFDGRFAPAGTFTPTAAASVAATTVARRYTLTPRLQPALYRVTVTPYTGARSLGRPVHRYLRVLAAR